jgi:type IV pilus assembly protein PilQ
MYRDSNMNETGFRWRMRWRCAVLLVFAISAVASAQTGALAPNPDPATNEVLIDPNNPPQVDFSNGCLIKFIAFRKDMTIRDGLRLLAELCKKNIVPAAQVEGPVTISRLYNVTFEQALEAVLGNNFKYVQDGDFVRVYTAEEMKKIKEDPDRMIHKVITLYYITASEAGKLVQPVLSGSPQAKIQMTTAAQKTISSGTSGGGSSGSGSGLSTSGAGGGDDMALNDMIVIYDYPENVEKAEAVIREVDVRPRQVLIEVTMMSAKLTENMKFGIDWNLLSGVAVTGFPANLTGAARAQAQGTSAETFGFANPGSAGLSVGFSADNVQALITAVESVADTTILANPKILAVNKQEGSLLLGSKIGYRSSTTVSTGGVATEGEVKFLQTGTQLIFRPYIGDNGYIRMTIYPKDSTPRPNKETGVPDEDTAELMTNVIVKDGQTLVIGGLFRDSTSTTKTQVPVLGNLPILGVLFRGTFDEVKRDELIVMLTPHIIDDPVKADAKDRMDDMRMKREAANKSLQGIDRARLAEDAYAKAAKYYLEGDTEKALFNVKFALMMRPTYLEALRLRERIVAETNPEEFKRMDSVVVENVDEQEAPNWRRY